MLCLLDFNAVLAGGLRRSRHVTHTIQVDTQHIRLVENRINGNGGFTSLAVSQDGSRSSSLA